MVLFITASLMGYAADSVTYALDEVGLSVSLPSEFVVFTRDVSETDPNLSAYGLTKESMLSSMISENIYLYAFPEDLKNIITVVAKEDMPQNFNMYSDEELSKTAEQLTAQYEQDGITCLKSEIYSHNQSKFMKFFTTQLDGAGYRRTVNFAVNAAQKFRR